MIGASTRDRLVAAERVRLGPGLEPRVLDRREQLGAPVWFRIWSNEHGKWWGPAGCGYTGVLERAGRFTQAAAELILSNCLQGGLVEREGMSVPCEQLIPIPRSGYGS